MQTLTDYSSLIAWRIVEILGYWIGGWDASQAAALNVLSLAPGLHYSHTYHPSHAPLLKTLAPLTAINIISIYLPLRFLRPESNKRSGIANATSTITALLSSIIYQLVLQVAATKFLTIWLLSSGWNLESVTNVHAVTEGVLLTRAVMMLPIGYAATDIIFADEVQDKEVEKKDQKGFVGFAGWFQRLWMTKLSPRTRKIIKRTIMVAIYQAAGATAGVAGTVKGGDLHGAVGLSGVWVVATTIVGAVFGWVGRV